MKKMGDLFILLLLFYIVKTLPHGFSFNHNYSQRMIPPSELDSELKSSFSLNCLVIGMRLGMYVLYMYISSTQNPPKTVSNFVSLS